MELTKESLDIWQEQAILHAINNSEEAIAQRKLVAELATIESQGQAAKAVATKAELSLAKDKDGAAETDGDDPYFSDNTGVRKDIKVFPLFEDPARYYHWNQLFQSTCELFNCQQVLDSKYNPVGSKRIKDWKLMNTFIINALLNCVKYGEAKGIILEYREKANAQEAYAALKLRYQHGQAGDIRADALELELQAFRINPTATNGFQTHF